ncbi:MAG: hypothetical protein AAF587_06540 [Bacteroidota bacterium]
MKHFHGTFRGWLAQWIPGNKLLLLGLFLLFYLVLMFGPSSIVPEEIRQADSQAEVLPESDDLGNPHVLNLMDFNDSVEP